LILRRFARRGIAIKEGRIGRCGLRFLGSTSEKVRALLVCAAHQTAFSTIAENFFYSLVLVLRRVVSSVR